MSRESDSIGLRHIRRPLYKVLRVQFCIPRGSSDSWEVLGGVLRQPYGVLGPKAGNAGAGSPCGPPFGAVRRPCGAVIGASLAVLGPLWAVLELSYWTPLG
eukprot:1328378-Pyramimonas_sp.AAC.1